MNITELARILRIPPQELRDLLPELGFSIGQKAIKVDNNTAKKVIKAWPSFRRKWEEKKEAERARKKDEAILPKEKRSIKIPQWLTVRELSEISQIPVSRILAELMKNGVFTSINEKIDFDTALIIGSDLNLDVNLLEENEEDEKDELIKIEDILKEEKEENLEDRPPVIVVMGHVDHGKTKLLDAIRLSDDVRKEAGGITQHIGAYQVNRKGRALTFIDTPGHEAFTAMRSRGAKVADIAVLVVAADDSVKQQTIEAFRIIEAGKLPYLVAINKVDKDTADINRVKQDLSNILNIVPEDWGGKTICVPVSAKENQGIEELLDMILLIRDAELADSLKANPQADAAGIIIESYVDKAAGPVATILIQNGTLRKGDSLCYEEIDYGRIRSLKNDKGEELEGAGPSEAIKVLGLKTSPSVGDVLYVGEGKKLRIKKIKELESKREKLSFKHQAEESELEIPEVKLLIKSDVLGSAEAVEESLMKINTEKVRSRIIFKGLGNLTEGDISRAKGSGAKIICFNTKMPSNIEALARDSDVEVKSFSIIYDLIEYVRGEMQELVPEEIIKIDLGKLKVLAIFRTERKYQIVGGKVIEGQIKKDSLVNVWRGEEFVAKGSISNVQSAKQEVSLVEEGQECGLQFEGKPLIEEGDILEIYQEESKTDKL